MMLKVRWLCVLLLLALSPVGNAAMSGKEVYQSTCIACHGSSGEGTLPGVPDLDDPKGVLTKSDAELAKNITSGFRSPGSPLSMPPKGGNPALNSDDIDAVIRYMRERFGGQ